MSYHEHPVNLVEVLLQRAATRGEETLYTFLKDGERELASYTYADLAQHAQALAANLQAHAQVGERALLLYPPGLDYITAFYACLLAGLVAVPTYPPRRNRPDPRLRGIAADSGARLALTNADILRDIETRLESEPVLKPLRWIDSGGITAGAAEIWRMPRLTMNSLAFLQYTSGSTGMPKGVMVSHANLIANLEQIHRHFSHQGPRNAVSWLPPYHDMGLIAGILEPLYAGFPVVYMTPMAFLQKPLRWLRAISRYRATDSGGPNFAYELCIQKITPAQRAELDLSNWRLAVSGAEPVRAATLARFIETFAECGLDPATINPAYGLAEATLMVSASPRGQIARPEYFAGEALARNRVEPCAPEQDKVHALIACGAPAPEMRVHIVEPDTRRPTDGVGEIWAAGPNVAQGYWGNAGATAETFQAYLEDGDGPYLRTGDLGFFHRGRLYITGRLKDVLIIRGRNHYPQDIEATVESCHPLLRPAACAAFSVEAEGEEKLVIVTEVERRYQSRRTARTSSAAPANSLHWKREALQAPDKSPPPPLFQRGEENAVEDDRRHLFDRRRSGAFPDFTHDIPKPYAADDVFPAIRAAVAEAHELQIHAIILIKPGTLPKTSSGKVQRHACRNGFLLGALESVDSDMADERAARTAPEIAPTPLRRAELLALPAAERENRLLAYLRAVIAALLGRSVEQTDPEQPILSLGLDSLAAVSLVHRIGGELELELSQERLLEGVSLRQICAELLAQLETLSFDSTQGKPCGERLRRGKQPAPGMEPSYGLPPHPGPCFDKLSTPLPEGEGEIEFPLSRNQRGLWFLYQLAPTSAAYNVFFAVTVRGAFEPEPLRRALHRLLQRHPLLRATCHMRDGQPYQTIHADAGVELEYLDTATWSGEHLEDYLTDLGHRPFDLEHGPLVRCGAYRRHNREHVLFWCVHHIVIDLWSLQIVMDEWLRLYQAERGGEDADLPPLPVDFGAYVAWQEQRLGGAEGERLWQYWQQQLANAPAALDLPTEHPRPPIQSFKGLAQNFYLDAGLTAALKELARDTGTTLNTVLLTLWQVLLYRYSGQEDVLSGMAGAGRNQAELESLVGYLVNPLVIRGDLSGNPSFADFLQRLRTTVLGALAHQDLPFQMLVERLQPERDPSRPPLFQNAFTLQRTHRLQAAAPFVLKQPGARMRHADLYLESLPLAQRIAQSELTLLMVEHDGILSASLEYNSALFSPGGAAYMAQHYVALARAAVADPARQVSRLAWLDLAERHRLAVLSGHLVENESLLPVPLQVAAIAAQIPDAPAVVQHGYSMSYGELHRRSNRIAHALRRRGVAPAARVAVCLPRCLNLPIALLGVLKAGAVYVPLDPTHPRERMRFMLEDAEAAACVTLPEIAAHLPLEGVPYLFAGDTADLEQLPDSDLETLPAPDTPAYVIYTSGSTGQPKGVVVPHRGLSNLVAWYNEAFAVSSTDRATLVASVAFDGLVAELWPHLCAGASVFPVEPQELADPAGLRDWLQAHGITIGFMPTPLAEQLLDLAWPPQTTLRLLLTAGDRLRRYPPANLPFKLFNGYGPTENSVATTCGEVPCRTHESRLPGIGKPIRNVLAFVLDPHRQPVPVDVPGELYIAGASLALGYLNRAELTAAHFVPLTLAADGLPPDGGDQPPHREIMSYRSGDLVCWREDGNLDFIGRIDRQVKIRGFRIELGEIEALLRSHSAVTDAAVVDYDGPDGSRRLAAYIVPAPFSEDARQAQEDSGEHIDSWLTLYEETYSRESGESEREFNIIGWNSSYTGTPIPAAEMRAWRNHTVTRILGLQPRAVLEVGCGSGILLSRIAPLCPVYTGLDFSAQALAYVERLQQDNPRLRHVQLLRRRADELAGLAEDGFDTVVLNSVVQYFPDADYLLKVLHDVLPLVKTGGHIFIGDVRSFPLLPAFHASVQLFQAPDSLPAAQLQQRIQRHVQEEEELTVAPAFFLALRHLSPRIRGVDIALKRGADHTEMTRFRYDVTLRLDREEDTASPKIPWLDWQGAGLDCAGLATRLQNERPACLGVRTIPNARVAEAVSALTHLAQDTKGATGELRAALHQAATQTCDPEQLWQSADTLGYTLHLSWQEGRADGAFDALWQRGDTVQPGLEFSAFTPASAEPRWRDYTNNPLQGKFLHRLLPELRTWLHRKLPDYMVPASFTCLDKIPLGPTGKTDRTALPQPEGLRGSRDYAAPTTPTEQYLAKLWQELLDLERVGIHDNFFELGGHSLLATQLISLLRSYFGVEVAVHTLFEKPTIAEIADYLDTLVWVKENEATPHTEEEDEFEEGEI